MNELPNNNHKKLESPEEQTQSANYSKSDKLVILLILLLIFITTASANMLIPSFGMIAEDFGIDISRVYIPDSIAGFVEAGVMVLWGYYTDRLDRNKIIHGGVFLSTIGFIFTSFCRTFEQLMIARIISGAGLGFSIPVGISILMDIVPAKQRSAWFGGITIFSSISNGTGQGLAAFLGPLDILEHQYGWQFPFLILSGLAILVIVILIFVKLPDVGSQEDDLAELQKFEELEYGYKINKKEFLEILKKPTNRILIINGFFAIIPGTVLIFTLITTFTAPEIGFLVNFPDEIKVQVATILGGLVGIGYNIGNVVLSYLGDKFNKKDRRNRTRLAFITNLIAIPFTILTILFLVQVDYNEIGQPEGIFKSIGAIFSQRPRYIGYLICALIGSFFSAGYVSNKKAIMVDVNLPEHRGTASSLFRLTEQIGKSITLMLISGLLVLFGTYKKMLIVSTLFWIPSVILWYLASKRVAKDMANKAIILRERQQSTFIDYFFELEIMTDSAIQNIQDAKDILIYRPEEAEELIDGGIRKFKFILEKSKKTEHLLDIEEKAHNLLNKVLMFKSDLLMLSKTPKKEDLELLYEKIDEMMEESDFGKIEILYDDAYLRVCEARLRRQYNPFESIKILEKSIEIYGRVIRLTEDRAISDEDRILEENHKEFQERISKLLTLAKKSKTNTEILKEKFNKIIDAVLEKDISEENLLRIVELTTDYGLKLNEIVADTFKGRTAKKINKATQEIDKLFKAYDDWMNAE